MKLLNIAPELGKLTTVVWEPKFWYQRDVGLMPDPPLTLRDPEQATSLLLSFGSLTSKIGTRDSVFLPHTLL